MSEQEPIPVTVGSYGDYQWMVTTQHWLDDVVGLCPEIVMGKYLAITSYDSGTYHPSDEEMAAGWEIRKRITYIPKVHDPAALPTDGFDEWYMFDTPVDLGERHDSSTTRWLLPLPDDQLRAFVNYFFDLRRPADALTDLFWPQFERIRPRTYIADCTKFVTVVTLDKELFAKVHEAVTRPDA